MSNSRLQPALRALLFFASHPTAKLPSVEMRARFGFVTDAQLYGGTMKQFRVRGVLVAESEAGLPWSGKGNGLIWRAGPLLLKEIER